MEENNNNINEELTNQLSEDEKLAILMQTEYIEEARAYQRAEEEHQKNLRRLQNEENARIRLQQDIEYLETIRVLPKQNTQTNNPIALDTPILLPPPPPQIIPVKITPPNHFICPISKKIIDIPLCDSEDNICYDKKTLLKYLQENDNKNHNGKHIDRNKLIMNNLLKTEIALWRREHPEWNEEYE